MTGARSVTSLTSFSRLNIDVDAARLLKDFHSLGDSGALSLNAYDAGHVVPLNVDGWTALPLRSQGGRAERTDPGGPGLEGFRATDFLLRLPAFAEFLNALPCELRSVRLLALHPGKRVPTHRDDHIGFPFGQLRLHVPVKTDRQATITIDGTTTTWDPGAVWFGDFSLPHSISNEGNSVRVHLVMDCLLSPDLLEAFPRDFRASILPDDLLFNPPLEHGPAPGFTTSFMLPGALTSDLLANPDHGGGLESAKVIASECRATIFHLGLPMCRLERLTSGEWRICGWTVERTFSFVSDGAVLRIRRGSLTRKWFMHQKAVITEPAHEPKRRGD